MTSSAPLHRLTLTAFRGASTTFTLDFEKNRKLTLIYGENGSGKTTICDAFEFLASGKVGSLEDRGMGAGLSKFWPAVGRAPSEVLVRLDTGSGPSAGTISSNKIQITPPTAKPRIELLRHQQILRLIAAQPASRYNEIKRFIDIAAFETSEEALRQLGKSLLTDKDQAQKLEIENLESLQGFFEASGKPQGLNPLSWAKEKIAASTTNFDADIAAIAKLRKCYAALEVFPGRVKASQEKVAAVETEQQLASERHAEAAAQASEGASDLLDLLEAGQTYLHAHHDISECPLCGSTERSAGLGDAIRVRLNRFSALKDATTKLRTQQAALSAAHAARRQIDVDYKAATEEFGQARSAHAWQQAVLMSANPAPTDLSALEAWLAVSASEATAWADYEASWRNEKKFVAALRSAVSQYDSNSSRRTELERLIPKVDEALSICVAERQSFTDGVIKEIAQEVGRLYEAVHPGEALDAIALPLDPVKRASLELRAKFGGQEVPPQAYFSQSHLDTLGLCVFLALALRDRPEQTILILDDVLGSVDEPHVERVIHMVYGISAKFRHVIVTTHYRPWREKYRWGWLKPDQACQFIELSRWEREAGIRMIGSLPEVDRLKLLLAEEPVDFQSVCSKAGVILEAALDYLTQKYECSVPRRANSAYTIGDLLPVIGGKLREALVIEIRDEVATPTDPAVTEVRLKPLLDELQRIAQARNAFGAHFKSVSFEMLDADAVGFAHEVVRLMDALTHPVHGWPSNDKSGSYWRNSGDTRRLHPLKKPG
jgi:energy-coupling factor transporter ATP-binding protein EcfA2